MVLLKTLRFTELADFNFYTISKRLFACQYDRQKVFGYAQVFVIAWIVRLTSWFCPKYTSPNPLIGVNLVTEVPTVLSTMYHNLDTGNYEVDMTHDFFKQKCRIWLDKQFIVTSYQVNGSRYDAQTSETYDSLLLRNTLFHHLNLSSHGFGHIMGTTVGQTARHILPAGHEVLRFIVAFIHSEETFSNDIWGHAGAAWGPRVLGTVISTISTHHDIDYTTRYYDNIAVPKRFDPNWLKTNQHMHDYIVQQMPLEQMPKLYRDLIEMGLETHLFVEAYVSTIFPDNIVIDNECIAFIKHMSEILEPRGLQTTTKTDKEKLVAILAQSMYAIIFHQFAHWDIINPVCQLGLNAVFSPLIDKAIRSNVRDQPFYGWKDIEWTTQSTYGLVYGYTQKILSFAPITYSHW
jgi:hypothetical protein